MNNYFRTLSAAVILTVVALTSWSCYYDYGLSVSDYDAVITSRDSSVTSWGSFKTYVMPDSVVHYVAPGERDDISRAYDATILTSIASNMNAMGYKRIYDTTQTKPDVIITQGITSQDYTAYYGGWGGYWGWYGWGWYGWGGYYPPYYPVGSYTYTQGTLIIAMSTVEGTKGADEKIRSIWLAGIAGLVSESASSNASRIQTLIRQSFVQSPYLIPEAL